MANPLLPASKSLEPWPSLILGDGLFPANESKLFSNLWYLGRYIHYLKDMGKNYNNEVEANSIIVKLLQSEKEEFVWKILSHPSSNELRNEIISTTYYNIYGDLPTPKQFEEWNNKFLERSSYAYDFRQTILGLYNKSTAKRKRAVHNAYRFGMGRNATKDELDYWLPKKYIYKIIETAQVAWLYSPDGSKDLEKTVELFLSVKNAPERKADFLRYAKAYLLPFADMYGAYYRFTHPL